MNPRSIHSQMERCARLEEKALAATGLRERSLDRPQKLTFHNTKFPIGPEATMEELKRRYS